MGKQPLGALSKLLLNLVYIPEFIENLPDVLPLAKGKNMKRREQTKQNALDEDQYELQRSEADDGDHFLFSFKSAKPVDAILDSSLGRL
jgi:hypothetical protein